MGMSVDKRLEAGWAQRIAWSVLVVASLGLLVWVPFLYVAIRRGRRSDWGAFAAFLLYELVTLPWATVQSDAGDPVLGAVAVVTLAMAVWLLLFALFDKRTPKYPTAKAGRIPGPVPGPAPGNPYLR
jgi:tryptophan-rich sensory protein